MTTTTKYVLFGALGAAAILLLTTEKGRKMAKGVNMDNMKKWKNKLAKMGAGAADTIDELRDMLGNEIEGLSDDARARIESILDGAGKSASKMKKAAGKQLA